MKHYALDLETKSLVAEHPEYALQPWRVLAGEATISLCVVGNNTIAEVQHPSIAIPWLEDDCYVWTWAGVFDVAWLIISGVDCSKIRWLDAMSAAKWVYRSQATDPPYENAKRFSWALSNLANCCLKEWEHYEEFVTLKKELKDDPAYWLRRCKLDVKATHLLGVQFWETMTSKQRRGFLIEQEAIYPVAKAWVDGCLVDYVELERLAKNLTKQKLEASDKLQAEGQDTLKILRSPQKLSDLVYREWGVPFDESLRSRKAKTDLRPVNKGALLFLIERYGNQFPQLQHVVDYRKAKTKYDKFVKGLLKCREYLGSDKLRHVWRINSTYTGRCTVSSKG